MTADTASPGMSAITVRTVTMIFAATAAHIVRFARQQSVYGVPMNARNARNVFAVTVKPSAPNAKRPSVRTVSMKMDFVKIVKIKERKLKMKNSQKNQQPMLRFSPTAWAKLLFIRDITYNEVGGFGITSADDLLLVTDFALIKQKVTAVTISFEDESVADFFEEQVEAGRQPEQFARIWLHTHPGNSPQPSGTDESTFERVFGTCDWAVMAIVAQDGSTYARLKFNTGPGGEVTIPVCVDYGIEFDASDFQLWAKQYKVSVAEEKFFNRADKSKLPECAQQKEFVPFGAENVSIAPSLSGYDLLSEVEQLDPLEREIFMEELAVRSDFWAEYEGRVRYE